MAHASERGIWDVRTGPSTMLLLFFLNSVLMLTNVCIVLIKQPGIFFMYMMGKDQLGTSAENSRKIVTLFTYQHY